MHAAPVAVRAPLPEGERPCARPRCFPCPSTSPPPTGDVVGPVDGPPRRRACRAPPRPGGPERGALRAHHEGRARRGRPAPASTSVEREGDGDGRRGRPMHRPGTPPFASSRASLGYGPDMDPTTRDPRAQRSTRLRRRKTLHDTLVHLEEAISSPAAGRIHGWTAQVLKEIVEVRDAFDQHVIVTEKPDGLYERSWSARRAWPTTSRGSGRAPRDHDEHRRDDRPPRADRDRRRRLAARRRPRRPPAVHRPGRSGTARGAPTSSGRRTTSTSAASSSGADLRPRVGSKRVVRIALGQLNTTVGDLDGNVRAWRTRGRARPRRAPTSSCSPSSRSRGIRRRISSCARTSSRDNLAGPRRRSRPTTAAGCAVVTGFVDRTDAGLHNAAAVLRGGEVDVRYHKCRLPNYGVFDERRYFVPGDGGEPRDGRRRHASGLSVCEDAWLAGARHGRLRATCP